MLDKTIFCEIIELLRQQMIFDRNVGIAIKEAFGVRQENVSYEDSSVIKAIVKLLQVHFPKDKDGFCEIEHYCFILEFGKLENGEVMEPEELYDLLISQKS